MALGKVFPDLQNPFRDCMALCGEDGRDNPEPVALFDHLTASLHALLQDSLDASTVKDVKTQLIDEINPTGRAEVVSSSKNVETQGGELVVAPAVLAGRDEVVNAVNRENSALRVAQHGCPLQAPCAACSESMTNVTRTASRCPPPSVHLRIGVLLIGLDGRHDGLRLYSDKVDTDDDDALVQDTVEDVDDARRRRDSLDRRLLNDQEAPSDTEFMPSSISASSRASREQPRTEIHKSAVITGYDSSLPSELRRPASRVKEISTV
jgi:hypothetical protein